MVGGDAVPLAESHVTRSWCLLRTGNHRRALLDLEAAEGLAPELPGLKELQERLKLHRDGAGGQPDYYRVLGLGKEATIDMIRKVLLTPAPCHCRTHC